MKAATGVSIIILYLSVCCVTAQPSGCSVIPLFVSGYDESPLLCDGDAGGSELYVTESTIEHKTVGRGLAMSEDIRLIIWRRPGDGYVNFRRSSITKGGARYRYLGAGRAPFRTYFRELMLLVNQFETGSCPVDSKGQTFPKLAAVRGSLAALARSFLVFDCGEERVRYGFGSG